MDLTEKPSAEDTIGERVVNFLERSNKIFINIIKFFAALFLLMVVFNFFHWMYFAEDGMMIEPFEINLESRNMSGMLLADQLCCEINDIYKINSVYSAIPKSRIFDKPDDNYNIQQMYSKSPYVDQSISQIGTVGLEGTSISVGNLLLSLRELSGTHRNTLAVQFGRYGSNVNMVAVLGDSSWDVSRNLTQFNQSIEELTPGMMTEMAFKITFETCENRSKLKPMNWATFKNLICGQEAYNEYFLTKNASHIRRAQDFIQLAIQNEPNYLGSYELLFEIGMAYYRTGNYDNAETIFKNTSQARPLESAIALGHLHLCKQNYRKSLAFFNKAIYIDPDYAEAWEGKATSLKFLGLYNDSFHASEKAIRLDPKHAITWIQKGNTLLFHFGDYDEAIQAYDRAIKIDPNEESAYNSKAELLEIMGKYDEAIEAYSKSIEINPEFVSTWEGLGRVLSAQGKYNEAIEAYDIATEIESNSLNAWEGKGDALAEMGKFEEAIQAYDKAIEIFNSSYRWNKKALALEALGRNAEASDALDKADELVHAYDET